MIVPARMPAAIRARPPTTVAMSVPYWANFALMAFTWKAICGLKMPARYWIWVLKFWICAFA